MRVNLYGRTVSFVVKRINGMNKVQKQLVKAMTGVTK